MTHEDALLIVGALKQIRATLQVLLALLGFGVGAFVGNILSSYAR